MNPDEFEFKPPPEAPVFEPTAEDFKDPLAYIAKIRPIAELHGICKIKPPPEWQPPFVVDVDNFRFTPRMQRLNELEATTRVKLNFLDQIAKFWELQGSSLKIPNVERKALDLFTLYRVVLEEGGSDIVSRERRWSRIATRMGYPPGRGVGSLLRQHYERILYPYHVFQEGASIGDLNLNEDSDCSDHQDKDYIPHGIPSRQAIKPPADRYARRSKRCKEEGNLDDIDYSTNNELKKLQFYGAGPKMPGFHVQGAPENEEESKAYLKENHIECFKDIKMGQGAKDLKMGFGNKHSGNFLKETRTIGAVEAAKLGTILKRKDRPKGKTPVDQIVCNMCGRGDEEASILLCDGCDDSYHTFCLIPPINEIPKGDWRCPCCVAKYLLQEVNKPQEAFGFEQAQREYTLQEFGLKADEFKTTYFNMPVHRVPFSLVEKEFWRIVNAVDEDVTVEYGADLHTIDHGSGFPNKKTKSLLPGDEEYVTSGWNLNNLPVLEGSVLKHINADISGMKIPWTYVGMCFATFCWHNEDHWSYSINYLHWGEPKTWYGAPGGKAESFEEAMRSVAPELFNAQPDLLHQLVTIMNPNLLISQGVPICRTNQQAGEFVVTFPRSYHAGFNQGYNFAEAVNFCPADWLPIGRVCVSHYGMLHRFCVFSHDELVCKMASDPDRLDISIAASTYQDMLKMVISEKELRKTLFDWGVTQCNREVFELLPDDERQCEYCKTTCFLSAVTCSCNTNKLVCIPHRDKLCVCPPEKHTLMYRYTLDELPGMLQRLKVRAESFDIWCVKVKTALTATESSKLTILDFKELLQEAEEKRFPNEELFQNLSAAVEEGEKCAALAQQLLSRKVRTRTRQSGETKTASRLTLEDLQLFHHQLSTLACEIKEAFLVKDLLDRAVAFEAEAKDILNDEKADSKKVEKFLEAGLNLDIDLPEIPLLKQKLQQKRWLEEVNGSLIHPEMVTLDVLRKLLDKGISIPPDHTVEKVMAELQELLTFGEKWEEKAKMCLQAKPKHSLQVLEQVVKEAGNISVHLPNVMQLADAVRKAKEWISRIQALQNGEHYPYLEILEYLVAKGKPIPVRLEQLAQMEGHVEAAKMWREKTARAFMKKNSQYSLVEILSPRKDIGAPPVTKGKKKKMKENDENFCDDSISLEMKLEESRDTSTFVANFKEAEKKELHAMLLLREKNVRKHMEDGPETRYCVCNKPSSANMIQCDLCKDWFHANCVTLPKAGMAKKMQQGTLLSAPISQGAKDVKFLCPLCLRSRRPRLEVILPLLMSLQKLSVRLPEGEALQCLTERGMSWQDRAKQVLKTDEIAAAYNALTKISQHISEQEKKVRSENIINDEIRKAANNPELQQNIAANAFGQLKNLKLDDIRKWRQQHPDLQLSSQSDENVPGVAAVQEVLSSGSSTPMETDISLDLSISTPRKHARKSPLVTRQMESPVLQLSDSSKMLLEELLVEGDLLELTLDETFDIWKILQATKLGKDSFSMSPFSDIEEGGPLRPEKKKVKKRKLEDGKSSLLKSKIVKSKNKLKLSMKDNKQKKKKLRLGGKLFASSIPHSLAAAMASGDASGIKHKKFKSKLDMKDSKKEGVMQFKRDFKDGSIKGLKMKAKNLDKPKKIRKPNNRGKMERKMPSGKGESRENEPDDLCSAGSCLRPIGEAVNWVQCDGGCEQWFHLLCVGLDVHEISESEDYICPNCVNRGAEHRSKSLSDNIPIFELSDDSNPLNNGNDIISSLPVESPTGASELVDSPKLLDIDKASEVAVSVLAGFAKSSFAAERRMSSLENSSQRLEASDF